MYKIAKKHVIQGIVVMSIAALGCQAANAAPLAKFTTDGWTQFASEDQEGSFTFVDPGWGGQAFDAEYLYYKQDGNTLSIGLQAGFDLVDGHVEYNGTDYYAGDLALSFDGIAISGDASTYEYAFDFGNLTKDYQQDNVGGTSGINEAGLYQVITWNNDIAFGQSSPFAMETGNMITIGDTDAQQDGDSYWRTVSFDLSLLGLTDYIGFDAHWTMSCGNDAIDGTAPVPEPATMLLFGSGLAGLASMSRKRRKK